MPNPEVKPTSADGTALETVWESKPPPTTFVSFLIPLPYSDFTSLYAAQVIVCGLVFPRSVI
jgi:hypothetical protein